MAAEACDPSTAEVEAESGVQSQPLVYNIQDPVTNKQKKQNNITFSFSTSVHTVIVPLTISGFPGLVVTVSS